jgi:hypothetical protein
VVDNAGNLGQEISGTFKYLRTPQDIDFDVVNQGYYGLNSKQHLAPLTGNVNITTAACGVSSGGGQAKSIDYALITGPAGQQKCEYPNLKYIWDPETNGSGYYTFTVNLRGTCGDQVDQFLNQGKNYSVGAYYEHWPPTVSPSVWLTSATILTLFGTASDDDSVDAVAGVLIAVENLSTGRMWTGGAIDLVANPQWLDAWDGRDGDPEEPSTTNL